MKTAIAPRRRRIIYPESDGKPLGENTWQVHWITMLLANFQDLFHERDDVFVAADLFWYPVQGQPAINTAPDVMIAFGRPKGHRRSYRQWNEGGIAPQIAIEVLSPSNTAAELRAKLRFYEKFGVEEYYLYHPNRIKLRGYRRGRRGLIPIRKMDGWVSPRMGVRFDLSEGELVIHRPDGIRFRSYTELRIAANQAQERAFQAESLARRDRQRAEEEKQRAEEEKQRAQEERQRAEEEKRRAEEERQRAEEEKQRADAMARKLRKLGIDPDAGD